MSLKQKVVSGAAWSALQKVSSQVIQFSVFLILAALLEPESFGLVALAVAFIGFLQVFLDQGFSDAVIQRENLEPEHLDTAFWSNVAVGLMLSSIALLSSAFIAELFKQPTLGPIIDFFSLTLIIGSVSAVQQAILRREFKFKSLALRNMVAIVAGGIVATSMAFYGMGVWSLVGKQLVEVAVRAIILWKVSNWRPRFKFSRRHFGDLFHFGINITAMHVLTFSNRKAGDFIIGYFLGAAALGYYHVGTRIIKMVQGLIATTINSVAMPAFSRLQSDVKRVKQAFFKITNFTVLVSFPAFGSLYLLSGTIVDDILGERWHSVIPVMSILACVAVFDGVKHAMSSLILGMGKSSWRLKLQLLEVPVSIVGVLIAVNWGINAVALTNFIVVVLFFPVWFWCTSKLLDMSVMEYLKQCHIPFLCTAVLMGYLSVINSPQLLTYGAKVNLLVMVITGIMVYFIAMLVISPKTFKQLMSIATSLAPKKAS